jgi:spore coat polysaccharide biosynthesis protein SpsF
MAARNPEMKTVAIIQARMGSTRLPGKILKTLVGKSVLAQVIARVAVCPKLDSIVVATTDQPQDAAVAAEANRCGAAVFRGSEQDVLSRYYLAARENNADVIVRITSDCPLYDGNLLGQMLKEFHRGEPADYMSNVITRSFPRGLDTEIFTFAALERAHGEAREPHQREHVTPYIYEHPELFRLRSYTEQPDNSSLRWTLDTPEDWQFVEAVYQHLHEARRLFTTGDVLNLLKAHPELANLNAHVEQKKTGH